MSRFILAFLIFLLLGAGTSLVFTADNGYVLIRQGDTVLETSLAFFTFVMIAGLILISIAWRVLAIGWRLPERLGGALSSWRDIKAGRSFRRGLTRLFEGRWSTAEVELTRRTWNPKTRLVNYLGAARAAHMQGSFERRDHYLALADACHPGSDEAVLLTQAELLLDQKQYARALPVLERLHKLTPDHPYALERLLLALWHLQEWPRIRELLPTAEALGMAESPRFHQLQILAYAAYLESVAGGNVQALEDGWNAIPRKLRQDPDLVARYAGLLSQHEDQREQALKLIQGALKHDWRPELLKLYGNLEAVKPLTQLVAVEGWLKQHGEPAELLLLAARLSLRNQLWGKARSYLDTALEHCEDPKLRLQILQVLAQLAEQTNDTQTALNAYKQGLEEAL